jgi:hypothetical protein
MANGQPHWSTRCGTNIKSFFETIFRPGLGVPIIVTVLLALAPVILLYQQNQLVALQEKIVESQTGLMQLQTLTLTKDFSRKLFDDIAGVVYLTARVEAATKLYKAVRDTSVSVKSRDNAPKALIFDERVDAKIFFWISVGTVSQQAG